MDAPDRHDALRLDNQLCFVLYTTSRLMTRAYQSPLHALGLTYPQYLVMLVLWQWDTDVAAGHRPATDNTINALGEALLLDSGTLTPLLRRLEAAGLVDRVRSTLDQRRVEVGLTAHGRALRKEALAVRDAMLRKIDLGKVNTAALRQGLESLLKSLLQATSKA